MNTIDLLGEEQAFAQVVDRTIQTFEDDEITNIGNYAFRGCSQLTTVNFPAVTSIGQQAFYDCSQLTTADFPVVTTINKSAFYKCSRLSALILRNNQVVTLTNTNAFTSANNLVIYVPDNLVDDYKAATNWSTYASRIKGISELPS